MSLHLSQTTYIWNVEEHIFGTYFWVSRLQPHEEKSHTSWLDPADECWDGGVAAKLAVLSSRLWIVRRVTYCMSVAGQLKLSAQTTLQASHHLIAFPFPSQVQSWVIRAYMRGWLIPPWIRKPATSWWSRPSWERDTTLSAWVRWTTSPLPICPWVIWPGHCAVESWTTSPPWCLLSVCRRQGSPG